MGRVRRSDAQGEEQGMTKGGAERSGTPVRRGRTPFRGFHERGRVMGVGGTDGWVYRGRKGSALGGWRGGAAEAEAEDSLRSSCGRVT